MSGPTPTPQPQATSEQEPAQNAAEQSATPTSEAPPADPEISSPIQISASPDVDVHVEESVPDVEKESENENASHSLDSTNIESTASIESDTAATRESNRDVLADASQSVTERKFPGSAGRAKSLARRTHKRENDLQKILAYLTAHAHITNDEIQKLIAVSDSTASRYAEILILRGKLFRTGKGRSTRYTRPR